MIKTTKNQPQCHMFGNSSIKNTQGHLDKRIAFRGNDKKTGKL